MSFERVLPYFFSDEINDNFGFFIFFFSNEVIRTFPKGIELIVFIIRILQCSVSFKTISRRQRIKFGDF